MKKPASVCGKKFIPLFLAVIAVFSGCGVEEYYYLPQIPEGNIEVELNTKAVIRLPNVDTNPTGFYYFKGFNIYYRIYVSGLLLNGKIQNSSDMLGSVNSYLYSDYSAIYPSTDSTNTSVNTSIASLFRNRNYYELALAEADIKNVLSKGSTAEISFEPNTGRRPTLSINGGTPYTLYRSDGENTFTPVPNRFFLNSDDLNKTENINSQKNADVANMSGSPSAIRYTYVSMYIVMTGMDSNFTTIYGNPTFIGVLKLPEAN
ncbi:MAG: hypothetical protein LBP29_05580 [Treponema sp.]|jgi:hypothetical protein|nr:hypothetical protein [Treponema sp.]